MGDDRGSGTRKLVFRYEVIATDADTDGVRIASAAPDSPGQTRERIVWALNHDGVRAPWRMSGLDADADHQMNGEPYIKGVAVASSPAYGATYRRTEAIRITFTFDQNVRVEGAVTGDGTEALTVEFARSVSGGPPQYAWCGVTDSVGRVALDIVTLHGSGVTGYYSARARNEAGGIVGRWHSIPLNEDHRQILELTLGGAARVLASHALYSARIAPPENARPDAGLAANFPNPFNSSTLIAYRLADAGPVRLEVFNSLGQRVNTLVDEYQAAGRYAVRWHARDGRGNDVAAGVYLVRLFHPEGVDARRMLYLK